MRTIGKPGQPEPAPEPTLPGSNSVPTPGSTTTASATASVTGGPAPEVTTSPIPPFTMPNATFISGTGIGQSRIFPIT